MQVEVQYFILIELGMCRLKSSIYIDRAGHVHVEVKCFILIELGMCRLKSSVLY